MRASVSELIQDAFDMGIRNKSKIAELIGVSRKSITRAVQAGRIEYYEPFDSNWGIQEPSLINSTEELREEIDKLISECFYVESISLDRFAEDISFDRHVRQTYGDIKEAIIQIGGKPYLKCFTCTCVGCKVPKLLTRYKSKKGGKLGISRTCSDCLYDKYVNNPKRKEWVQRRRALKKKLPNLSYDLGNFCLITGSGKIAHEHFIPLGIGHGGTYQGNMIPFDFDLNNKKLDNHPFTWFEANRQRFNLDQSRFDAVVADLAAQNGLTPDEYRQYVDWCFDNKRSLDDIIADNKRYGYVVTSAELWREATGRSFPLRFINNEQAYASEISA